MLFARGTTVSWSPLRRKTRNWSARVAHIAGGATSTAVGQLEGYKQALSKRGLFPPEGYVVTGRTIDADSWSSGHEAMEKLLKLNPPPDAVFCYNAPIAIGAIDAILAPGFAILEEIAVIGCGNLHFDKSLRVPLSSVDQQCAAIGESAGKLVLSIIEAKTPPPPQSIMLEPSVVARQSTRRTTTAAGPLTTPRLTRHFGLTLPLTQT